MADYCQCVLLVLVVIASCVGCAVSPEEEERRLALEEEIAAILSVPLDPEEFGETQRCLSDHEYRNFRALDERRILFEGRRGKLWINTLRARCPDLRHAFVLQVRSISPIDQICSLDSFYAGDWFSWPWYRRWPWSWGPGWGSTTSCTLGKFQPVTEDQVRAIEAAIEAL